MNTPDLHRYRAIDESQLDPREVDLDAEPFHDASGVRVTEAVAQEYTRRRGRPSLSGGSGSAGHLTLRVTDELRTQVEAIAVAEGRPVAEIARQALREYVLAHGDPSAA